MNSNPGVVRCLLGMVSAAAMVGTSVAPAAARDHGRYGWGGYGHHRHYRHRDGLDAGDVIGIAALIGAVAVIASAASKDRAGDHRDSRTPDPNGYPEDRNADRQTETDSASGEDAAIDACVDAVRDEAERNGGYAEILDVEQPLARGQGEWDVEGRVEQRQSYRDADGQPRRFSCDVRDGRVADVRLSADMI